MTDDKVVMFPANRIVRHNPGVRPSNREIEIEDNFKLVWENFQADLTQYNVDFNSKEWQMHSPMLEDIIKGLLRSAANPPTMPEPPPKQYA